MRASCGLPVRLTCPDGCVVVVEGPDLDGPAGWARLLATSPRFVASTALRDLGVPTRSLPCGQAIDALLPSGEVRAVELPTGAEVWCGSPQPWSSQAAAACNAAASERSPRAARFDDPDVRILRFDR
ncbi:MAG: hypothetical protein KTR31_24560 [Myxococcales bacterium]|nr:hypothetical protein [Myxococcales bacterium]